MDTNSIVYRVKLDSKDMKGSLYELKDAYKELERAKKELENRNVGTNDADYRLIKSQMKDVQALLGLYYKGWKDIQEVVEKAFILPTNALEATLRDIEKKMKELSSTPEGMEALAELQAQQAVLVDTIRKRNLAIRNIEQNRLNLTKLSNQQLAESLKSAKAILAVETRDTEESKKRHDMALKHAMDVQKIQDKQAGKQNIDEAASVLSQKSADLTIGRIKEAGDTVSRYQKQLGEFFDEATGQRFATHLDDAQRLLRERATQIAKGSVQATYDEMNKALPILRQMRSEELEGSDKAKLYDGWIAGIQQRAKHGAEVIADSANIMAEAGQLLTQSINNSVSAEKEALSVQQAQTKEQEAQVKHILAKEKAEERIDKLAKEQSSKQRAITKQRNIDLQSAQQEADEALAEDKKYRGTRTRAKNLTTQRDDAQRAKTDAEFNLLGVNRDIKNTEDELAKTTEERKEAEKKMLAIQATTIEGRAKINGMMTEEQAKLEVINNEQQRGIDLLKKKREEEEAFQNELTEIERNRTRIQSDMQSTQSTMEVLRKAKPDSRTATGSAVDVTRMLGEGGFVQKTWLPDIQKAGSQLDRIEAKFKSEGKQIPEQIGVWRGMLQKVYTELTDQERGLPARLRQSGGVMSKEVFDQYFKSVNTLLAQVNSDIQYAASGDGSMFGRYNTTDGLFKAVDKSTYSKQSLRGRRTRDTALTQELIDDSIDPTFLFGQFEQAQKLTLSNLFRTFDPQKELINSLANGGKFDNFVERLRDKIQAAFDAKASGGFGKGVFDDYIGSLQQIMDFVKKIQDAGGTDLFASARAQIKKQIAENESAIDATTDTAAIDNHIKQNKQLRSMLDDLDRVEGKGEWGIEKKNAALKNMEQQIKSNQQELDTLDEKQKQVEAQRAVQVSIDKANGTDISSLQQRLQRMTDQATPLASKVEYLQSVLNGSVMQQVLEQTSTKLSQLQSERDTIVDRNLSGGMERGLLSMQTAKAARANDTYLSLLSHDSTASEAEIAAAEKVAKAETEKVEAIQKRLAIIDQEIAANETLKKQLSSVADSNESRYDMESGEIAKLNAAKSKAAEEERKQTEELGKLQKSLSEEEYNRAKEEEQRYARIGKRKLASLQAQASDLDQQLVAAQSAVSDWLQKHKPEVLGEDSDWTKNYKKGSSQLLSLSREKGNEDLAILLEKVNSIDRMLNSANGATVNITSSVEQQIKTFEDQITNLKKLLDEFGDEIDEETQMSYETQIKSLTDKIQELRSGGSLNLSDVSTGAAGIKEQIQQIQTAHEKNVKIIEQWEKKDALILEKEKAIAKAKQAQADAEKEINARMNFQTATGQGSDAWLKDAEARLESLTKDSEAYQKLHQVIVGYQNGSGLWVQEVQAYMATLDPKDELYKKLNKEITDYNDAVSIQQTLLAAAIKEHDDLQAKETEQEKHLKGLNDKLKEYNDIITNSDQVMADRQKALDRLNEKMELAKAAQDRLTAANQRLAEVNAVDPRAQAAAWAEEERAKALAEVKAAQDEVTAATNATAAAQEEYNRKLTEGGGVSINKLKESFDKLRDLYLNEGDANKTAEIKALMDRVQARIHQLEVTPALAFAETMAEVRNVLDRQAADQATIDAAHQHSLDLQEQSNQRLADMKDVMLDKEREMVRLNELEAQQKKKDEEWERRRQSRVEKLNAAQEAYDTAHNDEAIAEAEQERGKQLQLKERFKARYVRGQQLLESADNWEKISNAIGGDHGKLAQAQQKLATTEDDLIKSAYALGDQFHVINGELRTMAAQHFSEKIKRINDRLEELDAPVKLKYNKNSKSENYGRMEKVELEDPSALYSDTISAKAQQENERARKVIQREVRRNMSRDRSISLAQTSSLEVQKMQENLAAMQREAEDIIVNRLQTDLQTALNGGGVRNGVSKGNVDRLIKLVGADGNGGLIGDVQAGIESFIKHEREYLEGRLDYQRQELSKAENLTDEQILERLTARPEAALEASQKQQRKWQKRLAKEDITDEERSKAQENLDKVERRIERIQTKLDTIKEDPRQYWNDTVIEGYKSRIEGWDTQLKYLMDGKYEQAYASKIERLMKQEERSNKVIAEQAAILKRNRSAYQKSQDDIIRYSDDLEALQHKQINHLATYAANGGGEDADKRIKAQMDRFRAMYEDATTGKHTEDERYRNALFNEFADDQKRQQISKNVFSGIVSSGSKSVLNDLQMMYQTLFKTADKAGQQFLADSMHGVQDVMTEMRRRLQQNDIAYRETDQIRDDATRTERRKELYKEYLAIIKESNAQLEQYRSSVRFVYEAWQQSDTTAKATVQTEEQQRESLYQLVKQTKEHGEVLELDEKQTKSYNSMVSRSTERLQDNYDKRNKLLMQDIDRQQELARIDALLAVTLDEQQRKNLERRKLEYNATSRTAITNNSDITAANAAVTKSATSLGNLGDDARLRADIAAQTQWKEYIRQEIAKSNTDLSNARQRLTEVKPEEANKRMQIEANVAGLIARLELLGQASQKADAAIDAFQQQLANTQPVVKLWEKTAEQIAQEQQDAFAKAYKQYLWKTYSVVGDDIYNSSQAERTKHSKDQETARLAMVKAGEGLSETERKQIEIDVMQQMRAGWYLKQKGRLQGEEEKNALALVDTTLTAEKREALEKEKKNITTRIKVADKWDKYLEKAVGEVEKLLQEGFTPEEKLRKEQNKAYHDALKDSARKMRTAVSQQFFTVDKDGNPLSAETIEANKTRYKTEWEAAKQKVGETAEPLTEADAAVIARDTFRGFVKSWMGDLSDLQKKLDAATDDNTKADLTRRIDALKEAIATVHAQYEAAAANVEQYGTPEDYRQQYNKYSRKKLEENLERQYDTYFEKHNTVDKDGNAYTAEQMAQKQQKADSKLHEAVQAYNESLEPLSDADATIIARDTYKKFITQWEGNIVKLEKKMATDADANKKAAMQRQVDALRETIDKVRPIYDQTVADAEQYDTTTPVPGNASDETPVEKVVKRQTRTILKDNKDLQDALVAREKAWLDSQEKVRGGAFYSTLRDSNILSEDDQKRYDYYHTNEYTDKQGNKVKGSIQSSATAQKVAEAKAENLASQLEEKDTAAFKKVREAALIDSIDFLEKEWKSNLAKADKANNDLVSNPDDPRLKAIAERWTSLANDLQTRIGTLKNDLGVLQAQMKAEGIATQVTKDKAAGKDQPQVEDTAARKNARERAGRNLERDERNISNKEMELENAKNIRRWGYYTQERAALETAVQAQVVGFTDKDGKHIDSEVERIAKSYGMEVEAIKTVKAALVDLDKAYAEHTKVEDAQAEVDAKQNVVNDLDGKIKAAGKRYEKATTDVERTSIEKEQEDLQTRKGKAEEELQKSQEEFDKVVENLTVKTVQAASDAVEVAEQKVIAASINALEEQMANADRHLNDLEQRAKTAAERYDNFMNDENNKSDLALIRSTNPADQAKVSPARRKELEEQLTLLQKTKEETRQAADAERERQQQERTGLMENVQQYRALQTETGRLAEEKKQAAERAEKERRVADLLIAGYADAERAASEWDAKLSEYHEAAKNRIKTETELTKAQRDLEDFDAKHPKEVIISEADLVAQRKELEDNVALAKQNFETADNAARAAREAELAIREQGNVSKAELKEQLALMQSMLETGHLDEEQRNTLNKTITETEQRIKRLSNIMFSEQETLDIFAGAEDALQRYNKGMDITVGEMKALHEQTMQVANDETQTIQRREQALAIAKQMQNALNGKGTPSADGMNLKQFDDEQVDKLFTSATETLRRYNEGQEVTVLEMKNMHEQIGTLVNDDYQLMDTHKKAIAIQKQYADALNKANVSKETPAAGVSLKQFESYQVEKMFTSADGVLQRYRDGMEVTVLEIQNMRDQMQALANDEYQTIQTHQQAIDVTRQLTDALNARKVAEKPTKSMNQIRSIINKGDKATVDEINEAIKSLKILKDNGSLTAQEFQKLEDKIKKLEQALRGDKVKYSESFVKHIVDSIDTAPIEDLQKALQQVEERIKKAERGQSEYVSLTEEYKKLKAQIDKHNESLGKTNAGLRENNNELAKQSDWFTTNMKKLGNYLGIFGGFRLITQEFRKFFQESMKYDDQLTNISKTTDLTDGSIRLLADGLKHIQTRSSIEQLNNLAYAAGKLGVKSVSDVMGFVRAADMLNVSLGEQLGNDAAEKLMKIANIMGTTQQYDLEEALERTGSAITYLAKNSAASGDAIVAFMSRTAGLSKQAGITTAELSGLAAAVSALNQPVEMSATSFSKMMVQMEKSYKTVGKTLKMTDQETERMRLQMETGHAMDAFLDMLRRVKEMGGLSETAKMAKDLGSEGNRVIQTLTTLSSSYDTIKRMVDDSSDAFERNTTVLEEYQKKNQNVAALWDRLQNNMRRMFISPEANDALREILIKLQIIPDVIKQLVHNFSGLASSLANTVTNHVYGLVNAFSALIKVMFFRSIFTNVFNWFGQLSAAVAAMSASLHKTSPAFRLYRIEMSAATTAIARFNAGVKLLSATLKFTNIVGIIFTIVGALWSLYEVFFNNEKEATKWADEISEATNRAAIAADAETQELEKKLSVLHDENVAETEKLRIRQSLQDTYGAYLGNINAETADLRELEKACRAANEQLKAKQILQATDARVKEINDNALNEQSSDYAGLVKLVLQRLPEGKQDQATAMKIVNELMKDWSKYLEVDSDGKFDTNKVYSMATKFFGLTDAEKLMQGNLNQLLQQYGAKPLNMMAADIQIQGEDINWDDSFQDYAVSLANKQREQGMDAEAMQNYGYSKAKISLENAMPEIKKSMNDLYALFKTSFTRGGQFQASQVRTQADEDQWAYMKRNKASYTDKQRNEDIANANKYLTVARDYLVDLRSLAVVELDLKKKQQLNAEADALQSQISNVDKFQEIMGLGIVDQEDSEKDRKKREAKAKTEMDNLIAKIKRFYELQAVEYEKMHNAELMTEVQYQRALEDNEMELNKTLSMARATIVGDMDEATFWAKRVEELATQNIAGVEGMTAWQRIYNTDHDRNGRMNNGLRRNIGMPLESADKEDGTMLINDIRLEGTKNENKVQEITRQRADRVLAAWFETNVLGKLSNESFKKFEELDMMLVTYVNGMISHVTYALDQATGEIRERIEHIKMSKGDMQQMAMEIYRDVAKNLHNFDAFDQDENSDRSIYAFKKYLQQFPELAEQAAKKTPQQLQSIYYKIFEYGEQYTEQITTLINKQQKNWEKMLNVTKDSLDAVLSELDSERIEKMQSYMTKYGMSGRPALREDLMKKQAAFAKARADWEKMRKIAQTQLDAALASGAKDEIELAQAQVNALKKPTDAVLSALKATDDAMLKLEEDTWGWLGSIEKSFEQFGTDFIKLRSWYEDKGSFLENTFGTKQEREDALAAFMDDLKRALRSAAIEQTRASLTAWFLKHMAPKKENKPEEKQEMPEPDNVQHADAMSQRLNIEGEYQDASVRQFEAYGQRLNATWVNIYQQMFGKQDLMRRVHQELFDATRFWKTGKSPEELAAEQNGSTLQNVSQSIIDFYNYATNGVSRMIAKTLGTEEDTSSMDVPVPTALSGYPMIPDSYIGTKVNDSYARRYIVPESLNLNEVKLGVRNRGDYSQIESEGAVITSFHPYRPFAEVAKTAKPGQTYLGVDENGHFKVGEISAFKEGDMLSRTYSNKVTGFSKDENGNQRYVRDTKHGNKYSKVPLIDVIGDDGVSGTGSLNVLLPAGSTKSNTYGSVTGGRVIMQVGNEIRLVSGSLDDIESQFNDIKGRHGANYVTFYTLDNGSFSRALRTKDGVITSSDLHAYDAQNGGDSGNFLYLMQPDPKPNKYKERVISGGNMRTEKDRSYQLGHSLYNEKKGITLHYTADMNPDLQGVLNTFTDPKSERSAHVVIGFDGERVLVVPTDRVAFHAGESEWKGRNNVNDFMLGVEFQGNTYRKDLTNDQIESFVEWALPLIKENRMSLDDIVSHQMITKDDRKIDIDKRSYEKIIARLQQEGLWYHAGGNKQIEVPANFAHGTNGPRGKNLVLSSAQAEAQYGYTPNGTASLTVLSDEERDLAKRRAIAARREAEAAEKVAVEAEKNAAALENSGPRGQNLVLSSAQNGEPSEVTPYGFVPMNVLSDDERDLIKRRAAAARREEVKKETATAGNATRGQNLVLSSAQNGEPSEVTPYGFVPMNVLSDDERDLIKRRAIAARRAAEAAEKAAEEAEKRAAELEETSLGSNAPRGLGLVSSDKQNPEQANLADGSYDFIPMDLLSEEDRELWSRLVAAAEKISDRISNDNAPATDSNAPRGLDLVNADKQNSDTSSSGFWGKDMLTNGNARATYSKITKKAIAGELDEQEAGRIVLEGLYNASMQKLANIESKGLDKLAKMSAKAAQKKVQANKDATQQIVENEKASDAEILATNTATSVAQEGLSDTLKTTRISNSIAATKQEETDNVESSTVSMWGSFGEAIAKAWAQGGPYLGPILAAVVSAALGSVITTVFNMIGSSSKTPSTKTKLVSGMLTYDAGNVQSFRGVSTYDRGGAKPKSINMLPVIGDDGKVYMVPEGDLMGDNGMSDYTGMVNRPTLTSVGGQPALVGERGPEMVIGRETTQAMMMSRPDLIQQILEFDRNRSRGFAKTFDSGTSGSINNEQLTMNNDGTSQQELLAMLDANAAMMQQMAAVISRLSDQADEGFGVKMYGENGVGNASAKYMADARRMGNNKYVSRLFGK